MGMRVSCLQDNLSKGLNIVGRAVGTRSTLPVLSNILMATDNGRLRLAATNLEMGITAWIGEWRLLGAGILLHVGVFLVVYRLRGRTAAASATGEDPPARAAAAGVHRAEEGESLTR